MRLGFFGAANQNLANSNRRMSVSKVPVERQSVLAFRDALLGSSGEDLHKAQDVG